MTCDGFRRLLSDRLDGPLSPRDAAELERHLAGCGECRRFEAALETARGRLRLVPVQPHRDVAAAVRDRLEDASTVRRRPSDLLTAAAAFLVAFALAATVIGPSGTPTARAESLRTLVLDGQRDVHTLTANVSLTERGWHPDVPERLYGGTLRYAGAETLEVQLDDRTVYPPGFHDNDVALGVDAGTAWETGRRGCPTQALPECLPDERTTEVIRGLEPFDAGMVVPLELVVPVDGFTRTARGPELGTRTVAGRDAVGAEVTAAHLAGLLDPLLGAGAFRQLHPTDPATVWLDADYGIPLRVTVAAAHGMERQRWASSRGYVDRAGAPILELELRDVEVNGAMRSVSPPAVEVSRDAGFVDGPVDIATPTALPDGMQPHRQGRRGDVAVATWVDGRAWVRIRQHDRWTSDRLFGSDGSLVRRTDLGRDGVAYLADGGRRVLLHGADADIEVTGSLATDRLLQIAASLNVRGEPVPSHWDEASTATVEEAAAALPGLLHLPPRDGFTAPGVRVEGDVAVLSYAGDGGRGVVVTQRENGRLAPPLDDVVLGVAVRGTTGRYTPSRMELEWVEGSRLITLRSETLGLTELLDLAVALEPAS